MTVITLAFQGTASDGLTKLRLTWPWEHFCGKKTSHQVIFPPSFLDSERKFFGLLFKNFYQVCQSAFIPPVHRTNLRKKLRKKLYLFYHFWKLNKLFRPDAEAFSGVVQNCFLRVPRNMSGKICCFEEFRNSYQFWKLRENFAAFSHDVFVGVVEIAFHLSIWAFWGQKIRKNFYDFIFIPRQWAKKSGLPSNVLSKKRRNRNLPVQGEEIFFSVKRNVKPFSDIQREFFGHLS